MGVQVAVAVSEAGGTGVVGVAQMDRDLACPRQPGSLTSGPQSSSHPVGLRGGRQMHHGMGQVELGLWKADKLDGMGGASIFRVRPDDPNLRVVVETLTGNGTTPVMAQRFIPEISDGDKRILLIDGEPVPYALARIPKPGETRGNLAAGGAGVGQPLSERDAFIASRVAPDLRERGLRFVGIDVIGDYLTEINVTCPTCIRELDRQFGLDIAGDLLDRVAVGLG